MARELLVIHNPIAGRGRRRRLSRVLNQLRRMGCRVLLRLTEGPGHAAELARTAPEGVEMVVAAGGDGTVNEVINGLEGRDLPLAVIPLGTANVIADELGLGRSARMIARVVAQGTAEPVYLGRANGRRFALMVGVGWDARSVAGVHPRLKRGFGQLAYIWSGLRTFVAWDRPRYTVEVDGERFDVASVIVAKGRRYAGGVVCAPQASLGEPDLRVCLFERGDRLHLLYYLAMALTGRLERARWMRLVTGRHVVIQGSEGEPVQADGDIIGALPVTIEVDIRQIRLVHPRRGEAVAPDRTGISPV